MIFKHQHKNGRQLLNIIRVQSVCGGGSFLLFFKRIIFCLFVEYFKAIQSTLHDPSLISIIQAQIVQCEKTINFYRLKDRSEQVDGDHDLDLRFPSRFQK